MDGFVDLHCHMLCNTDDGASSEEEMYEMLDMAYEDGTRHICLTPHADPMSETQRARADDAFAKLSLYAKKYPDMKLYRGNELFFSHDAIAALKAGAFFTMNGTRYVLVEFMPNVSRFDMAFALRQLTGAGYFPLVAHVERYVCLYRHIDFMFELAENDGVCFQVNASSLLGKWGLRAKRFAWKAVKSGVVVAIASDAHSVTHRKPQLRRAFTAVEKEMGQEAALQLFRGLPLAVLRGENLA